MIETAIIGETVNALDANSAAIFLLADGNDFVRAAAHGWRASECRALDDTDLLVLALRAQKRAIKPAEIPWRHAELTGGSRAPLLAVAMNSREGRLTGIVLYGGHPAGGNIDREEANVLEARAHAASLAFDGLESERLRAENERENLTIADLRARLDELRRAQSVVPVVRNLGSISDRSK